MVGYVYGLFIHAWIERLQLTSCCSIHSGCHHVLPLREEALLLFIITQSFFSHAHEAGRRFLGHIIRLAVFDERYLYSGLFEVGSGLILHQVFSMYRYGAFTGTELYDVMLDESVFVLIAGFWAAGFWIAGLFEFNMRLARP
ncbi:hypothetical protein ACQKWADRAFT_160885 [Trichoderma austrokoningii]